MAFSAAAVIHFRAFSLAPWALYAAWLFVRERQWRALGLRDLAAIGVGAALAAATLGAFALVAPALGQQEVHNPVNLAGAAPNVAILAGFIAVALTAAALLYWARAWLDLAMLAWMALMVMQVNEAYPWHSVMVISWVAAPLSVLRPGRGEARRDGAPASS